ncbi:hypothetical protein LINGRAHAP2_LOCUS28764 [Linum grandiflorum]
MKHFLWRTLHDVLPTRGRLRRKDVKISGECGICGRGYEEAWHLFIECPWAIAMWQCTSLYTRIRAEADRHIDFRSWLWSMWVQLDNSGRETWLSGLHTIWREINQRVWQTRQRPPQLAWENGNQFLSDWQMAVIKSTKKSTNGPWSTCSKWHTPPLGVLKCNVDMASSNEQQRTGFGMALRDHAGTLLTYRSCTTAGMVGSKEGEAWALYEALQWIKTLGDNDVIFEGDSQLLATAINGNAPDMTEFGSLVSKV